MEKFEYKLISESDMTDFNTKTSTLALSGWFPYKRAFESSSGNVCQQWMRSLNYTEE